MTVDSERVYHAEVISKMRGVDDSLPGTNVDSERKNRPRHTCARTAGTAVRTLNHARLVSLSCL
jgi:hypothetical protein